jgi:hypothetical protein
VVVADEGAVGDELRIGGVVVEQAGLEVGHGAHAGLGEGGRELARLRELVGVPGEDVALLAAAGVARAEVEARQREAVALGIAEEAADLLLRVRRVGQAHRGVGVAERPARRQGRAADGGDVACQRLAQRRAGEDVEVEVAIDDLGGAVAAMVVVVLGAEVEAALGQGVVVQAAGCTGMVVEEERPVLVERVAGLGVVAERVERARAQAAAGEVDRAGLVAEAEVTLVGGVAPRPVVQRAAAIGHAVGVALVSVAAAQLPLALRIELLPGDSEGLERDAGAQVAAGEREHGAVLRGRGRCVGPAQVVAAPAFERVLAARVERPGARLAKAFRRQQRDAAGVAVDHRDARAPAALELQLDGAGRHRQQRGLAQRRHRSDLAASSASNRWQASAGAYAVKVSPTAVRTWPALCTVTRVLPSPGKLP